MKLTISNLKQCEGIRKKLLKFSQGYIYLYQK